MRVVKDWILSKLQARAKGNFLCAKLMVDWLKDEAFSRDDIVSQMPTGITDMYKRIFLQYKPGQLKYVRYAKIPSAHSEKTSKTKLTLA